MSRLKKIIRNIIILSALCFIIFIRLGFYLDPISAHESSERSLHYGPSKIVHIKDFEKGKFILGKYDKWFSCDTVNRELFFFWIFGSNSVGLENDETKAIRYTSGYSNPYYKVYGIINDDRVKKIEITLENGDVLTRTDFYDGLFLFYWKSENSEYDEYKELRGYDVKGNLIFEGNTKNMA